MLTYAGAMEWFGAHEIIEAVVIVVLAYALGVVLKLAIRKGAKRLAKKTKTSLDDELLRAMEKPLVAGVTVIGIFVALFAMATFDPHTARLLTAAKITGILWGCWTVIRVVGALFRWYAHEVSVRTKSKMDDKYMHVFQRIVNIIILAVVLMLLLQTLGVQITPLIASLGIGGLAIALALQDTLANFFSGFYIISDRAVQIGDYVEIEGPQGTIKGNVEDIGWRTSKLRTLTDNHVIVPNSTFANATVINYQAPKSEMALIIPVGVSYSSDLESVEKVTEEVIAETMREVEGGVPDFKPAIRYREFADSSINFIAILRVNEPTSQGLVRHEFIKRLKKRYDREGIEIPFPIRTVYKHDVTPA